MKLVETATTGKGWILTAFNINMMLIINVCILQGHTDELWGLASHPTQHQFMTSGSDKNIQLWDSMTRTVIWSKEIPVSH